MRLQPGSMFAGYAIERPLGAGGMGVVYLARHPRLQRSVALKVLNDAFAHDAKARARFEREAALITALDHPNIVPIYDRNSPDDEILWISMKFVEGGDAASVLAHAGGRVTPERAVRMIGDAGRALDHAHLHGVLHRDVKPANLLVEHGAGTFERTMVTDFGIARSVEDSETGSRVSATLAYTAPERFGGGPVDHRADLYSLGCTLFKLLTGEPPFARSDDAAVIAAHLHAPLPRLTDVRPGLPGGLDEVLATVLAKNPHDRYPDCESFAAAARAAVDRSGETVVARHLPDHTPSTPRRLWLGEDAETAPAPRLPSIPVANEHDSTRDAGTHATSASGRTDSAADPGPPHARGSFSPAAEQKSAGTGVHRTGSGQPGAGTDAHLAHNTHTEDNTRVDAGFLGRTAQPDDYGTRDAQGSDDRIAGGSRTSSAPGRSPEGAPPGGGRPGSGGIHPDPRPGGDGDDAGDATASERAHPAARRAYTQPDSGDARGDGGMFPGGASAEFAGGGHSAGGTAAGRTAPRGVLTRRRVLLGGAALALGAGGTAAGYAVFGSRGGDSASDGSNPVAAGGAETLAVPSQVLALAFTPDGSVLATGCKNNSTLLWNVATRQVDGNPLLGHSNSIRGVAFSPDGSQLLTGSEDGSARLWNAGTRQPIGNALTGHTSALRGVAFHPGGALMATGSDDGTAQVWTVNTRQPAGAPLTGHTGSVRALAFHPAGRLLATGSADGTARLWLVGTGTLSREPLTGHNGSIRTLACTPDGALLATAGDDAVIRLWDIVSHELSGDPLAGHAEPVLAIAFTADGALLASGSRDGTVRLWDTKTRQPLGNPLTGHTASVHTLAFTPDGTVLATGSADGKVFLWKVADHR